MDKIVVDKMTLDREPVNDGEQRRTVILHLPFRFKPISEHEIEIAVIAGPETFSEQYCQHIAKLLGELGAEEFLDDVADQANKQLLIGQIR